MSHTQYSYSLVYQKMFFLFLEDLLMGLVATSNWSINLLISDEVFLLISKVIGEAIHD